MLSGEGSFFLFLGVKCFHHESVLILSSTLSSPIEILMWFSSFVLLL